ncbi:hypothetical protein O6H91_13G005700 [Diphasiastrum complanatum]|uniref:Uncharacterized protein n=2 Tax=Diphasiastrum complanatum TaxID=34168 RepID=A0ACC2BRU6_DIPCM|nr:hypothetical protein O6H91_13G005600 [Diphasiastrum complanatum]KAJ7532485.1 hypothetical protein O6H91_13G005700 [Diphasiastrum complanatum]
MGSNDKSSTWWSQDTVAVVTGANRGIGLEIARQFAQSGITTILTARNEERGQSTLSLLKAEGLQNVAFHQLEVTDLKSAKDFSVWVKQQYGGLDILINNAAIVSRHYTDKRQGVRDVIDTNYYGVKNVTNALLPLIRAGGRIVNVSSRLGLLQTLNNEKLKETISVQEGLSENLIDSFVSKFLEAVNKGENFQQGWPAVDFKGTGREAFFDYSVSKIALNAYTKLLAFQLSNKIHVNSFCPGATQTDMADGLGEKTVKEGADTGVWLALLAPSSNLPSGKFFAERVEIAF